jgi:hypothetical protein
MEISINWAGAVHLLFKSTLWGIATWVIYCIYHEIWDWITWHLWLKWKDLVAFIACYMFFDIVFSIYQAWL